MLGYNTGRLIKAETHLTLMRDFSMPRGGVVNARHDHFHSQELRRSCDSFQCVSGCQVRQ